MSDQIKVTQSQFDILGNILETLRFRGSIFFRADLAPPWGFLLSKSTVPRFHIALKGDCYIGAGEDQVVHLKHREILMLPHGEMHWVADQTDSELVTSEAAYEACELGTPLFQQGELTHRLICGIVHYEQELKHPIIQSLPSILHFPRIDPIDPIWITALLIDSEMQENIQNTHIINRLSEVLFLQLLKKHVIDEKVMTGFFSALHHPRIFQLLELIHQDPQFEWSLSILGEKIGMSNATLTRHFKDTVGVSPMTYIANWRMIKAHQLVKYSNMSLDQVAESVGFLSTRTLSKAFLRHYNYTPSKLRKNMLYNEHSDD